MNDCLIASSFLTFPFHDKLHQFVIELILDRHQSLQAHCSNIVFFNNIPEHRCYFDCNQVPICIYGHRRNFFVHPARVVASGAPPVDTVDSPFIIGSESTSILFDSTSCCSITVG